LDQVRRLFAEWERRLSRFQPDSELSRLNARPGQQVVVSDLLLKVLVAALRAARATAGLYDPALLRALEHLGYDRSFEQVAGRVATAPPGALPTAGSGALPAARSAGASPTAGGSGALPAGLGSAPAGGGALPAGGGWHRIEVDLDARTVILPPGVGIDLGGIAKGMAVDAAVECLRMAGSGAAMVSAGGDLRVHGLPPGGRCWPVAIDGPRSATTVPLTHGALATSGIARRRWRQGRVERHHLLDPRDARPARTGLWSVTVAAATCAQAEVAAKVAFILGPSAGAGFLESKRLAGLLVDRTGASRRSGPWPAPSPGLQEASWSPASR
jgi:thiamine biosynthesis lipoprotein